jgi:phosphatidylglycerophosphate synthase
MSSPAEELDPTWTRAHALWLLASCVAVGAVGHPWPLAAGALLSFGVLCLRHEPVWRSRQLLPNAVTLLRLLGACALLAVLHRSATPFAIGVVVIWALDGLDGLVARRLHAESRFGALFDAEADAFLMLAATVELWSSGRLAFWVLLGGVLRYAYVLCLAWFPGRRGGAPRSQFARYVFGTVVLALALALVLPPTGAALVAALGTTLLTLSFLRSFAWIYGRRDSSNA